MPNQDKAKSTPNANENQAPSNTEGNNQSENYPPIPLPSEAVSTLRGQNLSGFAVVPPRLNGIDNFIYF